MTTLEKLKLKAQDKGRMPSIKEIAQMLTEFGIDFKLGENTNVVEFRSKGNRYVNSRHEGKTGKVLEIPEANIILDTSESFYSLNTWWDATKIVKFLATKGIV